MECTNIADILSLNNGQSFEIMNVVLRSLSAIDGRLIQHGERVVFILHEMLACCPECTEIDQDKLFVLGALHDIGAYKTEEIDNMVGFETGDVHSHAVYGYLFLQHFTQFREYAEAILYHHTDYSDFKKIATDCADYAQLIFLADRIDILIASGSNMETLRQFASYKFNPDFVELFLKAERARNITNRIISGDYKSAVNYIVASMHFTSAEIFDLLNLLVFAMDFRSAYTVSHTANTSSISMQLGAYFGLSDSDLQILYYGAAFHDIGKIAIPVEILEKTGRLTDEEMRIMRTHVSKTEEILRGFVDDEICDIAVRHHEKLNGRGYPYGVTGGNLTLMQRIVAVADILSALIGKRSYKDVFPKDHVIGILNTMRDCGEICPVVCDMALTHYDAIVEKAREGDDVMKVLYHKIRAQYDAIMSRFND